MTTVPISLRMGAKAIGLNLPLQLPKYFKLDLSLITNFGLPMAKASLKLFQAMDELDPIKCLRNLDQMRVVLHTIDSSLPIYLNPKDEFVMRNGNNLHTLSLYMGRKDIALVPYNINGNLTNGLNQQKLLAIIDAAEKCFHLPSNLQLQLALERSKDFVRNSNSGISAQTLIAASVSLKSVLNTISQERSNLLANGNRSTVIDFLKTLKTYRQYLNGETPQFEQLCEIFDISLS
ncbi:MAG: hypothetical protein V1843_00900 [bacterium]